MATIKPTSLTPTQMPTPQYGVEIYQWASFSAGDTLVPLSPSNALPLAGSAQFSGAFGGTVTLQGSNDGTNWIDLKDTGGAAIIASSAAAFEFSTSMSAIRPNSGSGVTATTLSLSMRRG